MADPGPKRMTYAEYLAAEEASEEKHHFVDGEMFAMSGGTIRHSAIQTRLIYRLGVALDGRRCRPHGSELRIYLPHLDEACYADALVVCGRVETDPADHNATINPTVVFEVLSPTTEAYDRGKKFEKYRGLESLREYVLLSQDRAFVEGFRKGADGSWTFFEARAGDPLPLPTLGVTLAVDDIYRDVFEAAD